MTMMLARPVYPGILYTNLSIPAGGGLIGLALQHQDKRLDGVSLEYHIEGLSKNASICLNAGASATFSIENGLCGFLATEADAERQSLIQQTANGNETWFLFVR